MVLWQAPWENHHTDPWGSETRQCHLQWKTVGLLQTTPGMLLGPSRYGTSDYGTPSDHLSRITRHHDLGSVTLTKLSGWVDPAPIQHKMKAIHPVSSTSRTKSHKHQQKGQTLVSSATAAQVPPPQHIPLAIWEPLQPADKGKRTTSPLPHMTVSGYKSKLSWLHYSLPQGVALMDSGKGKLSPWAELQAVQLIIFFVWTKEWFEVRTHADS